MILRFLDFILTPERTRKDAQEKNRVPLIPTVIPQKTRRCFGQGREDSKGGQQAVDYEDGGGQQNALRGKGSKMPIL
jgi:hypothetical protein